MYTFSVLWASMVANRPLLDDDAATVTISVSNFKALLAKIYDAGVKQGVVDEMGRHQGGDKFTSLFEQIFGK